MKKEPKKTIHPLMKKNEPNKSHPILDTSTLTDFEINADNTPEQQPIQENTSSVWPVEPNILIETANYGNNILSVTLTNLSVESIDIISMGVKYTSSNSESIDFQPTNISLAPGESTIQIPCPKGNPFKFVIRTANKTGSGSTKENMSW